MTTPGRGELAFTRSFASVKKHRTNRPKAYRRLANASQRKEGEIVIGGRDARYFLSCYISPPDNLSVLAPRHDQNIALWRTLGSRVELVRIWELERISGQKHHYWP